METKPNILVVDDDESLLKTYRSILKRMYNPILISDPRDALEALGKNSVSLVLLDVKMPQMDGLELLQKIKQIESKIEVIMITAVSDIKFAVKAIKLGAYDYIAKPFEIDELLSIAGKALEKRALVKENEYLRQTVEERYRYVDLIGQSNSMQNVFKLIDKIAATDSTVLVTGESGTGKELVAHAIHIKSRRVNKPFIVVNCAAIPETLVESELFGHECGAYTGAMERREGKFELANEGTIFLDEIGCMKPAMQSKLLRVLESGTIERVGGGRSINVDTRVIAATNVNLGEAIQKNEFREDLFYRLNIINVRLPLLRERKEDIPVLLDYFLGRYNKEFNKKIKGFSQQTLDLLKKYDWPGNVRELQNIVERAVVLHEDGEYVSIENIPLSDIVSGDITKSLKEAQMEFERGYILKALQKVNGNQSKAAELLQINRTTLIAKIKQLGIKQNKLPNN
jgi:two-component system response regulator AtoC